MLERIITITQLLDREVRRQAAKDRTDLYTTTQSLRPWQKKFRNSYRFEEDFFSVIVYKFSFEKKKSCPNVGVYIAL